MLLCLVVCLTLLASLFLPSVSIINMYIIGGKPQLVVVNGSVILIDDRYNIRIYYVEL